ncbi:TlpA disulfide reductase family protein [Xanthomarina sp. F2636L]|uniref:TlpA disulfide reductase family protein n=1 Tax=Xanthomarina sp. F2636L TaxID=2996018 RepID=UPI00225DE74E|nr:TlpA disulfide reductase family protein [Xanthomarina sp. F2636L]MCX7549915.1 TlpA disulfide reductase family protein [Xanthomarina sp. F2636L]
MLRNQITLLLILITLFSCKDEPAYDGFIIKGEIDASNNNKKVKLISLNTNKEVVLDSTTIENGALNLKGKVEATDLYYLAVDGIPGFMPIMLKNEEVSIKLNSDKIEKSVITGSKENDLLKIYQEDSEDLKMKNAQFGQQYKTANSKGDTVKMDQIKSEFTKIIEETHAKHLELVKNNTDLVTSAAILVNILLAKGINKTEAENIFNTFSQEVISSKFGKAISENLTKATTDIGSMAPNFSAPNPEGKLVSLEDIKGKVTIIDFWAAWCGPCRKENPNVVKVYEKYHDKGLEIIGVSLDGTPNQKDAKGAWVEAIKKDNLTWHQVSNLNYFNDPIAKLYSIQSIPATYILDSQGVIVAKNLRGNALEAKIAELLN